MAASSTVSAAVSGSWTAVGHTCIGTSVTSEPAASLTSLAASLASQETAAEEPTTVDLSLLQQQQQLAERLKQMEAMLEAQRRAQALEKVRMDLRIATVSVLFLLPFLYALHIASIPFRVSTSLKPAQQLNRSLIFGIESSVQLYHLSK
ncbi:hypothetical protein EMIHUDRAFT_220480 [Emiliania huxleyi CCMP1516]|uniref:Uncharacterized protein n=2 Tax=Emiliania huxleyi TaxID=2903 RepID=A0A0D3I167_EMIH1|nr:hypothetical protein EMIHUDRAFT_220480 [Emiliania huxleyi CCMP1516]EOD05002.1 hypothetical protein EMIHUDRAFT_220480 [Emiliania huxleyi CCMP1516]|eukprot:XP_005757431.1 hypothetical protein EMIHUDRAFT_220480 [Emiliania huxleyi CCMP1516]